MEIFCRNGAKTLFWNVDFLLDMEAAEIEGFSAIRSAEAIGG